MRKIIIVSTIALVVLTSAFECEGDGARTDAEKPSSNITKITGNVIVSNKSDGGVTGYKQWKTSFFDGGPYGSGFTVGAGKANKVAGFCAPANRKVEGKLKNGFGFEFGFTMRSGDCKRLVNLDEARVTVTKGD